MTVLSWTRCIRCSPSKSTTWGGGGAGVEEKEGQERSKGGAEGEGRQQSERAVPFVQRKQEKY